MTDRPAASERLTPPSGASVPLPAPGAPPPGSRVASHFERCYGCGAQHPTGLHVEATVGQGLSLTSSFTVTDEHQGAPGLAHGGVLTAAFDEALGMLLWLVRKPAVTVRLETDFRRPVPVGTTVHIAARVTGTDRRKVYTAAEGRLGGPDGEVAATAAGLFLVVPLSHFAETGGQLLDGDLQRYNP